MTQSVSVSVKLTQKQAGALYMKSMRQAEEIKRLRAALTELVRLKDMKDRGFGAHDTEGEDEYMRCKPAAWQAARAALTPNVGGNGRP